MTFNSFSFYLFFILITTVNYLLPQRWRWAWLLIVSYVFYGLSDPRFPLVLLACTGISYLAAMQISTHDDKREKKNWMLVSVMLMVGILILFKYLNFFLGSLSTLLTTAGLQWHFRGVELLYPIGISFYSFQVISYLLDVYSGKVAAERNFLQYALFVSFFPQLLIGPIERFAHLKLQLTNPAPFYWQNFVNGLVRIGWGLFKKLVIADRLAVTANTVFGAPADFASPQLIAGVLAFSFQIYLDFAAYCDIAIGTAKVLGIELMENFDRPYFARSVIDFWRRWHISLSNWLRDYVFLKLNYSHRRRKPRELWTALDVMATFLLSGLWHGANWTFIIWGLLHGVYQMAELLTQKTRDKIVARLRIDRDGSIHKSFQVLFTFVLVSLAWIFFKAESVGQALQIMRSIFTLDGFAARHAWAFLDRALGLDTPDFWMMTGMLSFYLVVEATQTKHDLLALLNRQPIWLRWIAYYALFFAITIFGFYGDTTVVNFVYFQF